MTNSMTFRPVLARLAMLALCASLGACSSVQSWVGRDTFKTYVPEVVQGNFVSKEQRQALRPGMPKAQVRDILGTPLITSLFRGERWDYAFSIRRQNVEPQQFKLTVWFQGDVLDKVESDELPSEQEFVQRLEGERKAVKVPALQASPEQLKAYAVPEKAQTPAVPPPLPSQYPPLEAPGR
ncbi:outer membrane protein assembly factor BamE [Limnohabitans sp.]|uniref:outer membrane protein assembly factor BamE n=1 Tax=Limnohabitans sp. TaxID=1907725 RepID=UPI00311D4504